MKQKTFFKNLKIGWLASHHLSAQWAIPEKMQTGGEGGGEDMYFFLE